MLKYTIFSILWQISMSATDFENARIVGLPRLVCSKKSMSFHFDTNISFQGRIGIMKKIYIPECNQDFSSNNFRNASFIFDISRCTDTTYMTNGSRVLSAHVEIGFHPLVITSSDRVYSVQCIDNSYAVVRPKIEPDNINCTHVVRLASRWESATVFHVGDAVVHEWNCMFDNKDFGKYQTFVTSCNAISQAGQSIHLIDENGCIIDSELMGDLVYNNYMPKIYARAKIFKLMNGEKYRIECNLQLCSKNGVCKGRPFPPRCAFTKDEIVKRFETKGDTNAVEDFMTVNPGTGNNLFDKEITVTSEWITVHYNQYTNVEQLHERYFLTSMMNMSLIDERRSSKNDRHFLMAISYREPDSTLPSIKQEKDQTVHIVPNVKLDSKSSPDSPSFQNVLFNPTLSSSEENSIESITASFATLAFSATTVSPMKTTTTAEKSTTMATRRTKFEKPSMNTKSPPILPSRATTTRSTRRTTTPLPSTTRSFSRASASSRRTDSKVTESGPPGSPPATMMFFSDLTPEPTRRLDKSTNTKQKAMSTTSTTTVLPFIENDLTRQFNEEMTATRPTSTSEESTETISSNEILIVAKEKYRNRGDWRLDDRTINDTDLMPEKQTACANATIISSQQSCKWSGIEHLLVIWSFGSLLVWIVMIAACFYKQTNPRPDWVDFRERELQRATQARVLPQDHPWLHADAFEEPAAKNKHHIDMSKL